MKSQKLLLVAPLLALVACGPAGLDENSGPVEVMQSKKLLRAEPGHGIPGSYIVVFADDFAGEVETAARALASQHQASLRHVYTSAVRGFAAEMSPAHAEALARNPQVQYVEEDQIFVADTTQTNATWGIDRIDQRNRPLSGTYSYTRTGAGVNAYVIDTGIRLTHSQFGGRAVTGFDAVTSGGSASDCNGHGTHVAGTIGGSTYGVAKGVKLFAVRVLNCAGSGTTSGVVAGVDWVKNNHVKPAVANMSLGGSASTTLDNAVANAIAAGVTFAIAGGNSNANACNYSPARVSSAVTVGATTSTDARASYSNYGSCLDLFAPGSSITSAWYSSDTATNTISGTSMASPHVAGAAARYLQSNPGASPATVASYLTTNATTGVVTSPGTGSPNRLLYVDPAL
jgi:subtilisin family serine protease